MSGVVYGGIEKEIIELLKKMMERRDKKGKGTLVRRAGKKLSLFDRELKWLEWLMKDKREFVGDSLIVHEATYFILEF